jgi:hypothetical protein
MKGKLSYMSPEQLNSRDVDRRTDVFAAGVVAWECLAGRRLFAGSDPGEVLAKVLTLDIPAPIDVLSSVPRVLSNIVMRALERSPEQRWQTARDFAIELERNVVLAAPHMVGDWVAQHAGDALQDRRRRVEAVERASVDLGHVGPGASAAATAEFVSPVSARTYVPAEPTDAAASSATARSSTLSVTSSAAANATTTLRQLFFALLIGALGVAIAGGVWYWQQHTLDDADGRPSTAALPDPSDELAAPPRHPSRGGTAAPDDGTPPPMVEVDSLPESEEAPDGGAMVAGADPGKAGISGRSRRAGRRPNHSTARASATAPPPKVPRQPALAPAPTTENPECSPPWYIDAKGIRRLKPKCLETDGAAR